MEFMKEFEDLLPQSVHKSTARNHCFTCGGDGFKDKDCPECGMRMTTKSLNLLKRPEKANELLVMATNTKIPNAYIGVTWVKEALIKSHLEHESDLLFSRFADQLEKIHNIFADGRIPNKSAIIIAPPQHSKVTFAYSCMQCALDRGLSVAPLLDSQEVKRLLVLAAEKPSQIYGDMSYEEYISSDIVFVTITKTSYREEAYQVIEEMLDKRSRRGLPTFFISRYSLETMSKRDWSRSFEFIKDYNNTENSLKYPAIINYWVKQVGANKGE